MSDTVKAALIIGICLMLGLWGVGWWGEIAIKHEISTPDTFNFKLHEGDGRAWHLHLNDQWQRPVDITH